MQQNSLEDFSNILKNFRKAEDLTLDTLSKYLGVSDVYVSKLENGKRFPSKKYFILVCIVYGSISNA